jgi:hypothetical protein
MTSSWPSTAGGKELALIFDRERPKRLLVIPALFDEANKLRHFTVEMMRLLDGSGMDSFLPDLPGQNESLAPLRDQTLESWRDEALTAAQFFRATHILTIRAGALLAPQYLPGWRYAPIGGTTLLRSMLRARVLASKETGRQEDREALLAEGRTSGLELAGYDLGAAMIAGLETAEPPLAEAQVPIAQEDIGGAGLWLRAEPGHDPEQSAMLAHAIVGGFAG